MSIVAGLVAGCAPAAQPSTTAGTAAVKKPSAVVFYQMLDMSGPYAADVQGAIGSINDAFEYINANGGVDGVPWKLVYRDTGGDLKAAVAAYESFKAMDPPPLLMQITESATNEALKDKLVEDGIVAFTSGGVPSFIYPPRNQYSFVPSYADVCGYFMDWVVKTQPGPIKLAFLTYDSVFGRAILTDEVRNYAKQKGIEIVDEEVFGMTQMDLTTQLTRIKDKGANWVYSNILGQSEALVLKSAQQLGLLDKMKFSGCQWTMLAHTLTKVAGPLAEGYVAPSQLRNWEETDIPYIKLINQRCAAAKADQSSNWMMTLGFFLMATDLYNGAIKEVGWDKLDAAALKRQIEKLNKYDPGFSYITLTAKKHESTWVRMEQVKNGIIVPMGDFEMAPNLAPAAYQ
jgi:branched-chain amino acid transport system substrate-binding protein